MQRFIPIHGPFHIFNATSAITISRNPPSTTKTPLLRTCFIINKTSHLGYLLSPPYPPCHACPTKLPPQPPPPGCQALVLIAFALIFHGCNCNCEKMAATAIDLVLIGIPKIHVKGRRSAHVCGGRQPLHYTNLAKPRNNLNETECNVYIHYANFVWVFDFPTGTTRTLPSNHGRLPKTQRDDPMIPPLIFAFSNENNPDFPHELLSIRRFNSNATDGADLSSEIHAGSISYRILVFKK